MQFFDQLGELIEQRWKDKNYGEWAFPEIAAQSLAEAEAIEKVDLQDILRCVHNSTALPQQHKDDFSDLPVTLYQGPRFSVDVYFWLDGTTAIHQHSFSGAFQVLSGSSIHNLYTFEQEQGINSYLSVGRVLLQEVQSLTRGEIRKILPGRQFIHSLFHLDRPSVTITVRTNGEPTALPQYSYLKPYFSIDPFFKEQLTAKKVQSVRMLLRMKDPTAYPLIDELVSSSDFHTTYLILSAAFEHLVDQTSQRLSPSTEGEPCPHDSLEQRSYFRGLLKKARRRHGSLMNFLLPVLGEVQRERALVNLRSHVFGNEHRFFLALLLNVEQRPLIFDFVRQRFPDRDPIDTICNWVRELSCTTRANSHQTSILGIDPLEPTDLLVLKHLLEGLSIEEIKGSAGREVSTGEVEKVYDRFQKSILLRSILPEQLAVTAGTGMPRSLSAMNFVSA